METRDNEEVTPTSEDSRFIELLYRGVLKRQAEVGAIETHKASLGINPDFGSAVKLLHAFVNSPESRDIIPIRSNASRHIKPEPISHIVSAGSHCLAAFTLKQCGMKLFSGPFDWIFSSLAMVNECIATEFKDFLDKKYYEPIPHERRRSKGSNFCDHVLYRDKFGIGSIFNHWDPLDPSVFSYLERCVSRFRNILVSGNRSVLFGVCAPDMASESDFYTLCDLLDAAGGKAEAHIIWLVRKTSYLEHRFSLRVERGGHRLYRMQSTSRAGPTAFEADFDNYVVARFLQSLPMALKPGAIEVVQGSSPGHTWME